MSGEWKSGRRRERRTMYSDEEEIKKGPWKVEEDEVLLCHVSKYGPRDWSSIRSKGLLRRTGKSCRLRWVNKLRPNLKNGMKFSAEEERIVIELQEQFGNRWAKIATHLPGRTDNDVKNFWSSRQKRLARLLQSPSTSSSSPPIAKSSHQSRIRNRNKQVSHLPHVQSQVPNLSFSAESSSSQLIQTQPLREHVPNTNPISCEQNIFQLEFNPVEKNLTHDPDPHLPFPPIADLLPGFQLKQESEIAPNFFDILEHVDADMAQFPFSPCFGRENEGPDIIFDELPLDMFDQIESLKSNHDLGNK